MDKLQQLQKNLDEFKASVYTPIFEDKCAYRLRIVIMVKNFEEKIHKPFTELLKELGLNENPTDYIIGEEYDR